LFLIRENEQSETLKKITIDSEEHITIDTNQDPINQQLVIDVQTSDNQQARRVSTTSNFSYQLIYLQIAHSASVASENHYMHSDVQRPKFSYVIQRYL